MRRNKFNFFSSYGLRYRSGPGGGQSFQLFKESDFAYQSENTRTRSGWSHNFMAGVDFFFTEKSVLTVSGIYRHSDGLNTSTNTFIDFDDNENVIGKTIRREREEEPENNSELALSYRKDFQKKGHYFTADFKWIENVETEYGSFTNTDVLADSVGQQRSTNTENERNILFQADYIQPLRSKGKFEAGVKGTHRVIDNDFLVEQLNGESDWSILPDYDNHLIYSENILAAYAMLGNEVNRFSYQIGLRGELTDITTDLEKENETNYQNYFNLFPSTHLSYKITEDKTVQLSYSYRISRPGFRELMPFSNFSNNRSIFVGNPTLRPEYTNSIETAYLLNWDNGSILSSAYYRYRTGVIQRITVVDSVGYNRIIPVNLATENAYGLEFNFTWDPLSWLRWNMNANFYRAITEGQYEDEVLDADTYTWTGRAMARVSFLKKWDLQASFNYRAPRFTPQGKNLSMYSLDLALARDVFKGNGTLTASVRDLFNTRKFRNIVDTDELYAENEFQWRARQLMLTFTYRLNKKKENNRGRDNGIDGGGDGGFDQGGEF
jgi:outer membrane receptor protein involved in Fe transport